MKRIERLLRDARHLAGAWKPNKFSIYDGEDGTYILICEMWNGVLGSLRRAVCDRTGVNPYRYFKVRSKAQAYWVADRFLSAFEKVHDLKVDPAPIWIDHSAPTDAERKAAWTIQGSTVMERNAARNGRTLEAELLACGVDPSFDIWPDIIRWRKEEGME